MATDTRGLVHAVAELDGEHPDVLRIYGRLVGPCETTDGDLVRRVARPVPSTLCAEVLSL